MNKLSFNYKSKGKLKEVLSSVQNNEKNYSFAVVSEFYEVLEYAESDNISHYDSPDKLFDNYKPEYYFLECASSNKSELFPENTSGNETIIIDDIPILVDYKNNYLNDLLGDKDINIFIDNKYLKSFVKVNELVLNNNLQNPLEIKYKRSVRPLREKYKSYPAPNKLPWEFELCGGVFQRLISSPLLLISKVFGDIVIRNVNQQSQGVLPRGLTDSISVELYINNTKVLLEVDFDDREELDYLEINTENDKYLVDYIEGKIKRQKGGEKHYHLVADMQLELTGNNKIELEKYTGLNNAANTYRLIPDDLSLISLLQTIFDGITCLHVDIENRLFDNNDKKPAVLLTGASGQLGKILIDKIISQGFHLRILVRKLSDIQRFEDKPVDIFFGDVADIDSLREAVRGMDYVIHAAADTDGGKKGGSINTFQGSKNVIDLCIDNDIKNLVFLSTCNVYDIASRKKNEIVNEQSRIEPKSEDRGDYTHAKLSAEKYLSKCVKEKNLNAVCLRPGTYFGETIQLFTPMIGESIKSKYYLVIGNGNMKLPLVYIDNIADAIINVTANKDAIGNIYNVVDKTPVTKREYINKLLKNIYPHAIFIYLPYTLIYFAVTLQEMIFKLIRKKPLLTQYRLKSSQNPVVYDSSKIEKEINWKSPYSLDESFQKIISYYKSQA